MTPKFKVYEIRHKCGCMARLELKEEDVLLYQKMLGSEPCSRCERIGKDERMIKPRAPKPFVRTELLSQYLNDDCVVCENMNPATSEFFDLDHQWLMQIPEGTA